MAKFCRNCGAQMDDADRVCGQCGTPIHGVVLADTPVVKNKGKDKKVKRIAGLIVAIVAIAIIFNVVGYFTGYKGAVNKMVRALKNDDTATLESLICSPEIEIMGYWDEYDKYDELVSDTLDKYEDSVGAIKKISYEIIDETELSDRRLDEIKENLETGFTVDTSVMKKMIKIDLKITVKGASKSANYYVEDYLYMVKENSGWKIYYDSLRYLRNM
jgi:hypothetical protein